MGDKTLNERVYDLEQAVLKLAGLFDEVETLRKRIPVRGKSKYHANRKPMDVSAHVCAVCKKICKGRAGLGSHQRLTGHRGEIPVEGGGLVVEPAERTEGGYLVGNG